MKTQLSSAGNGGTSDRVICDQYAAVPHTADEIVSDPELSEGFLKLVNQHLPPGQQYDAAQLNKRLLNLRRRGEDNGGLIRKQRGFNGRNIG
ncbi:hypothetical protein Psta_0565 [Pirellula staleyi DSM 6068]|uniref:Uncharacterized protein n=1 Tax=Pirellula staleyi (strain ATCC 27377 / DSM 6068 / ICPB 4128) TaxID=530564 RepID=D2R4A4_PIRSD|nr:hypothetical protein [Pirellula staleyi]ADB15252.1 hypothetical protein Psta_0565 [Pirellula staleyi DSM 6068]